MKRLNFNIKDRKVLTLGLCLVLVCIFTLTVAYSALSAVLTINCNARVSASNWDIYLNNPRVTNGSATTNLPVIKTSSTLEFEATLNMPGDFYEFVVDVVNAGDIDAMIENVVKNPELTAEQAKFLKYEVSYQNGESVTTNQLLAKDTTMPIKVRIEYRNDLSNTDLPTGQVVLDLSLTLEYVQSDGTGSSVTNNGIDQFQIGNILTIGSENFYVIGTEDNNVKLLSMYNLYVGGETPGVGFEMYGDEATGMQDENMRGYVSGQSMRKGVTFFSEYYSGSIVEEYVNNYKNLLESNFDVNVLEARLITYEEVVSNETFSCIEYDSCSNKYPWLYYTSYWTMPQAGDYVGWAISSEGKLTTYLYSDSDDWPYVGVRPVIVISKDYFN